MTKQYPLHRFSLLLESDLEQVLEWRNAERVRRNMHQDQIIGWDQHLAWFSALKNDKSKEFWVFHQNDRPIGVLNFSCMGTENIEWGCYLGETNVWPGSGILLEVAALDRATKIESAKTLIAEVLSFNKSAIGLHRLFEYPCVSTLEGGVRNDQEYSRLIYRYVLSLWQRKRATLILKLPQSIRTLIETIEFRE